MEDGHEALCRIVSLRAPALAEGRGAARGMEGAADADGEVKGEMFMYAKLAIPALAFTLVAMGSAQSQSPTGDSIAVTADNFVRAESDLYFANVVKDGVPKKASVMPTRSLSTMVTLRPTRVSSYVCHSPAGLAALIRGVRKP